MRYIAYSVYIMIAAIGLWWLWGMLPKDPPPKEPEKEKPDDGPV